MSSRVPDKAQICVSRKGRLVEIHCECICLEGAQAVEDIHITRNLKRYKMEEYKHSHKEHWFSEDGNLVSE